jgi:hypothetical protein
MFKHSLSHANIVQTLSCAGAHTAPPYTRRTLENTCPERKGWCVSWNTREGYEDRQKPGHFGRDSKEIQPRRVKVNLDFASKCRINRIFHLGTPRAPLFQRVLASQSELLQWRCARNSSGTRK